MKQTKVTFEDVETGHKITVLITGDIEEQDEIDLKVSSDIKLLDALEMQHGKLFGVFGDALGELSE